MMNSLDSVREYLKKYDIKDTSVTVAFSGGADSVSLLYSLCALSVEFSLKISAAHFNHLIRGEEADRDEAFCKSVCEKLNIPFYSEKADVPLEAERSGESTELCARRLRYNFLYKVSSEFIATAHSASDNLETMLFNLSRGTGIAGLCGIPEKRNRIIRPLIGSTRAEIEKFCKDNKLSFVTDSTNLSDNYARNKIRHNAVPVLAEINSAVEKNALKTAELLKSDCDYLESEAEKAYNKCVFNKEIDLSKFNLYPKAIKSRVLRRFAENETGKEADSFHTDLLLSASLKTNDTVQLKNGTVKVSMSRMYFEKNTQRKTYCFNSIDELLNGATGLKIDKKANVNNLSIKNAADCDKIIGKITVRNREDGDCIKLIGRPKKSLHKLFIEEKIPLNQRNSLLIICDEVGIVWVQGFGIDERCKADKKTKNILEINF